jgi:hypothetical protein
LFGARELTGAGLPVPPGFVVGAPGVRRLVAWRRRPRRRAHGDWGYATRLVELVERVLVPVGTGAATSAPALAAATARASDHRRLVRVGTSQGRRRVHGVGRI